MLAIFGSIALDYVAVTPDNIFEAIAPGPGQYNCSPSFFAPTMYVKDGGTGANIAYGYAVAANALGCVVQANLFGACSRSRHATLTALDGHYGAVNYQHVVLSDKLDAQAHIITDPTNNQITAFHPGAMEDSLLAHAGLNDCAIGDYSIAIVSPSDKAAMLDGIDKMSALNAKVFFDPGQALGLFSPEELQELFASGKLFALICNHHEMHEILRRTGMDFATQFADQVPLVIVTSGANGINFYWKGVQGHHVPACVLESHEYAVDPTGCGDAFRAGFLLVSRNLQDLLQEDWLNASVSDPELFVKCLDTAATAGAMLAKRCLLHDGPQGYAEGSDSSLADALVKIDMPMSCRSII